LALVLTRECRAVFGYEGDKTVKLVQSGPGGLEDFRSLLTDDDIFYVVYSLEVKDQDEVDPPNFNLAPRWSLLDSESMLTVSWQW
jgi:hypothetical protein